MANTTMSSFGLHHGGSDESACKLELFRIIKKCASEVVKNCLEYIYYASFPHDVSVGDDPEKVIVDFLYEFDRTYYLCSALLTRAQKSCMVMSLMLALVTQEKSDDGEDRLEKYWVKLATVLGKTMPDLSCTVAQRGLLTEGYLTLFLAQQQEPLFCWEAFVRLFSSQYPQILKQHDSALQRHLSSSASLKQISLFAAEAKAINHHSNKVFLDHDWVNCRKLYEDVKDDLADDDWQFLLDVCDLVFMKKSEKGLVKEQLQSISQSINSRRGEPAFKYVKALATLFLLVGTACAPQNKLSPKIVRLYCQFILFLHQDQRRFVLLSSSEIFRTLCDIYEKINSILSVTHDVSRCCPKLCQFLARGIIEETFDWLALPYLSRDEGKSHFDDWLSHLNEKCQYDQLVTTYAFISGELESAVKSEKSDFEYSGQLRSAFRTQETSALCHYVSSSDRLSCFFAMYGAHLISLANSYREFIMQVHCSPAPTA